MIDPAEDLQQKKEHLKSLEVFMESEAYKGYREAREAEIAVLGEAILNTLEDSHEKSLVLKGELNSQREMLETFNDAREALKARIDELVERENQIATTKKV